MQPAIATAAVWALVLLCAALWRSGTFRAAAPVLAGPYPENAVPPTRLRGDEVDEGEDRGERAQTPKPSRRLTAPLPLTCAVLATALLRVGVLLALGR